MSDEMPNELSQEISSTLKASQKLGEIIIEVAESEKSELDPEDFDKLCKIEDEVHDKIRNLLSVATREVHKMFLCSLVFGLLKAGRKDLIVSDPVNRKSPLSGKFCDRKNIQTAFSPTYPNVTWFGENLSHNFNV